MFQSLKNIFRRKVKSHLIDGKSRAVLAFTLAGVDYYMFDNQFEVPAGRQMSALAIYEELNMRCDKEYLEKFTRAMDKILSDPKKIAVNEIVKLNMYLKERLELMPLDEHIYKMASVVFFDKTESLYSYDYAYNREKIARWKKEGASLDFFLQTPLSQLMPSLNTGVNILPIFSEVTRQINEIHQEHLTSILSEKA